MFIRNVATAFFPRKATSQAAGYDLWASRSGTIQPGDRLAIDTGVRVIMPEGYCGIIGSRSGLALNNQVVTGGMNKMRIVFNWTHLFLHSL